MGAGLLGALVGAEITVGASVGAGVGLTVGIGVAVVGGGVGHAPSKGPSTSPLLATYTKPGPQRDSPLSVPNFHVISLPHEPLVTVSLYEPLSRQSSSVDCDPDSRVPEATISVVVAD